MRIQQLPLLHRKGLIAWYPVTAEDGETVRDHSGSGYHLSKVSTPTIQLSGTTLTKFTRHAINGGGAANDWYYSNTSFPTMTSYTLSVWCNRAASATTNQHWLALGTSPTVNGVQLGRDGSPQTYAFHDSKNGWLNANRAGPTADWVLLVGSFSTTYGKRFVYYSPTEGLLEYFEDVGGTTPIAAGGIKFMTNSAGTTSADGLGADARVYDYPMSKEQMLQYATGAPVTSTTTKYSGNLFRFQKAAAATQSGPKKVRVISITM